ncbi:uncharacterized protein N7446_002276 [Penicillium canescens]|uniref:Inner kinetochore subunit AME1 domain-containing protein n=1 Tax=Penicillium canescens TaxID=5083 RepID=A0AAD6N9N5_PENCN|nr:uncharacterized protein N7446_002276 [Penicillium canescens]KAJ6044079.1 hypothetical protein N7460_005434 [Penicillium canescens]KAJ6055550.1 hypothetical protein N7444_004648 [Penicillium canescens]KAJ6074499.1 hypothetical protein N7446_002276 [Penicillium canescens]
MEPTREERQQMRQRGAGTRKAKEVNFGFSFGGLAPEPSAPAPLAIVPEPQPQTQPATTPRPTKASTQGEEETARTPGSARNKFPERPSTYDIPSDDRPEQTRSSKRRKINPIEGTQDTPTRRNTARPANDDSQHADHSAGSTEGQPSHAPPIPDATIEGQRPGTETSSANGVDRVTPADKERVAQNGTPANGVAEPTLAESTQEPTAVPKAPSSEAQSGAKQPEKMKPLREERHKIQSPIMPAKQAQRDNSRKRGAIVPASPAAHLAERPTTALQSNVSTEIARPNDVSVDDSAEAAVSAPETTEIAPEQDNQASTDPTQKTRKARGRPRKSTVSQSPESAANAAQDPVPETRPEPTAEQVETSAPTKRPRGRPSLNGKTKAAESGRVSNEPPAAQAETSSQPKRPRGRPSLNGKNRAAGAVRASPEPVPDAAEVEAAVSKPQRGRPSKKGKRPAEPGSEPQPTTEGQPSPEAVSTASKPRGRPTKKAKRPGERETEPDAEADAEEQEQPAAEPTEQTRRKAREPRGESFPVTVHRLANAVALGGRVSAADPGDEQDSADELSSRQRTKVPNRGGVNPADVLGQICRETLEKTLTTLNDGIANEENATRRAEWTRKRKAVEAFGSELESRLMDLSEMLDSNFVLGVQLKKAKKEMMELRSHLYRVKKEREMVALQMDAVRGKHIEEEKAKSSRTTINNSLHSLELALERNQNRTVAVESTSADLEFMLRTVADVSSRAPGAQGGLLNQIRAFNAQLEATASRLER